MDKNYGLFQFKVELRARFINFVKEQLMRFNPKPFTYILVTASGVTMHKPPIPAFAYVK